MLNHMLEWLFIPNDRMLNPFCDTPHRLKTSGFSLSPTSYAGMWRKPQTRGGCHHPDAVAMPSVATGSTHKGSSLRAALFACSTGRAGLARIAFFLQDHLHIHLFRFIGEQMADVPKGPLMQALIVGTSVQVLSDSAHISDDQRFDAFFIQRGNQMRGLFVLDILDLVGDLSQLFLL